MRFSKSDKKRGVQMGEATKFSNLQLKLLRLYSKNVSEQELQDIKQLLAEYFSRKLASETKRIWDEKGLSDDDMDKWLKNLLSMTVG